MTPESKIHLAFQMYDLARQVIWMTERQAHPNASPEERDWRMLQQLHGQEFCDKFKVQMQRDGLSWTNLAQNNPAKS